MPAPKRILYHDLATAPPLRAELWQTASRKSGRRIVVRDAAETLVFDTDDHCDTGNACNALERWLDAQVKAGTYAAL